MSNRKKLYLTIRESLKLRTANYIIKYWYILKEKLLI